MPAKALSEIAGSSAWTASASRTAQDPSVPAFDAACMRV